MAHTHGEEHEEEHGAAVRLAASAALFVVGLLFSGAPRIVLLLGAYLVAGFPVLKEAGENIVHGEVFDESFLMALASLGAVAIGEYSEAAAVMLLYQLGELLQERAVDSSRRAIRALMDVRPDHANVVSAHGIETVPAQEVAVGAEIEVRAGERVPLDGVVLAGESSLDTAALTGESVPRPVEAGERVLSGCVNLSGTLRIRVERPFGESAASRILALVEQAAESKARSERFITRFARVYTPLVVLAALLLALLPPLLRLGTLSEWVRRALNFLVISCPCALVISVPLAFFSGLGRASHEGVLVKGGSFLERLCRVDTAVFDKTGTLTEGSFRLRAVSAAEGVSDEALLELAAYAESKSTHPLAQAIVSAYPGTLDPARIAASQELPGRGVSAVVDGSRILCGTAAYLRSEGVSLPAQAAEDAQVFVARDGVFCGTLLLGDRIRSGASEALAALRRLGVRQTVMLTGDSAQRAEPVGEALMIDRVCAGLLPEEKLEKLKKLKEKHGAQGIILYVGDGINDTPTLAAADIGVAMGGIGSEAAMETADVVVMGDSLEKLPAAIRIARKTMRIARENIAFSIAVKLLMLLLSALGCVTLWAAVFADVGVCLLAVANSLRALR